MGVGEGLAAALAVVTHELVLFAAVGIAIGGLDDLLVDVLWMARSAARRLTVYRRHARCTADTLPPPEQPGSLAVFVAAWREAEVIGPMLRAALARYAHDDYRIYVGVYPNDPATQAAVRAVAAESRRVVMVGGDRPGPTTKAECLNRLWRRMTLDEAWECRTFKAVVIHDAEDVVHPDELTLFDRLIERFDLVQLPVLPLIGRGAVSASYADEFAESHSKGMVLREAIGAGVPSAGVGCAISRAALVRMAAVRAGRPFDEGSLTEDYELGLRLSHFGGRAAFVSMPSAPGQPPVATRAYFPSSFDTAVRQKTRWLIGIALAGWDRLGWGGGAAEVWMRLRDRKSIVSALVIAVGYLAALLSLLSVAAGVPLHLPGWLRQLLLFNAFLLLWRIGMRGWMVGRVYGLRQGCHATWRILVSNAVAIASAWRAVAAYAAVDRPIRWDKTTHQFPHELP